jgi:methionyl-tRNA synthetase
VIYVWLDALTNYISALGFGSADHQKYDHYWPADVHFIGKDIIRFHAVYWPAFLMAAGLPMPKTILAHGWWLRDNQKISKSTGNIVRPDYIIDQFGADALRFFFMRDMVFGQDSNYSDEAFLQRYNSDLANDLGNTLSRAIKMTDSYFSGKTPPTSCHDNELRIATLDLVPQYLEEMDQYAFNRAIDTVWKLIVAINGYIVSREPWKLHKEEGASEKLCRILYNVLEASRIVWVMLSPVIPTASKEALRRLGAGTDPMNRDSFQWGGLPNGSPVLVTDPIFPRVDAAQFFGGANVTEQPKSGPPLETTQAAPPDANKITIDQFRELDLRVGQIMAAEKIEKSKKLLKLRVSTGDAERTIVAGIALAYTPEELLNRKVVIVANLQPATLMGVESNGMVLAAEVNGQPSLLSVDPSVPLGTKVK